MSAIINLIIKIALPLLRFLKTFGIWFHFCYRFLVKLANSGAAYFLIVFGPLINLLIEFFTGKPTIITQVFNKYIMDLVNKITEITLNFNLQDYIDQLPPTIMEISCYLGVTEALQFYTDGMVTAIQIIILLKIRLYMIKVKGTIITNRVRHKVK